MPNYRWKGIENGKHNTGSVSAKSVTEAKKQLAEQGVILTDIKTVKAKEKKTSKKQKSNASFSDDGKPYNPSRIKSKELLMFTKKFATMVQAGLPILKTLEMLTSQTDNPNFKKVLFRIYSDVEAGTTLSEAFADHPGVFDTVYINLLKAGETSGKLTVFLQRLVIQIEKAEKIRSKVKGALTYPAILVVVATIVILIMLIKVVPVFQGMFAQMGHSLPGPTQLIVNISEFMREPAKGGILIFIMVGGIYALKRAIKSNPKVRRKFDELLLKLPVLGSVVRQSILAKIAMIQGNLSAAGVPVLEALDIVCESTPNMLYQESLQEVRTGISEGQTLAALYAMDELFPPTFAQMIAVGEETGNMDDMFEATARYYEEEFDIAVDRMTELLEPIMIVFMGTTVGFIIIAMYMPIFQVGQAVTG